MRTAIDIAKHVGLWLLLILFVVFLPVALAWEWFSSRYGCRLLWNRDITDVTAHNVKRNERRPHYTGLTFGWTMFGVTRWVEVPTNDPSQI